MVEITFVNKKGEKKINSGTVEDTLKVMADFEYVKDISDSIKQENIMVFDCKLDKSAFKFEFLEDEEYEELGVDEEYLQVLFEDIKEYLRDLTEDVEDDLQQEYKFDDIKCHFEIYDLDESFTDVKFVFLVSFKNIKRVKLMDLGRLVSKRQLQGSSKYYN